MTTAAEWRANHPTSEDGMVWVSIMSKHHTHPIVPGDGRIDGCQACSAGIWEDADEMERDSELFRTDYTTWYRQHNNGEAPRPVDWEIYRQVTRGIE